MGEGISNIKRWSWFGPLLRDPNGSEYLFCPHGSVYSVDESGQPSLQSEPERHKDTYPLLPGLRKNETLSFSCLPTDRIGLSEYLAMEAAMKGPTYDQVRNLLLGRAGRRSSPETKAMLEKASPAGGVLVTIVDKKQPNCPEQRLLPAVRLPRGCFKPHQIYAVSSEGLVFKIDFTIMGGYLIRQVSEATADGERRPFLENENQGIVCVDWISTRQITRDMVSAILKPRMNKKWEDLILA